MKDSILITISINIIVPVIILTRFSGDDSLGPIGGLLVALGFPFSYALYDFTSRRNVNFIPVLGFIAILLTGGIGLLELDVRWIAIKEAAVPLAIGLAIVSSRYTRYPIVPNLALRLLNSDRINPLLCASGQQDIFRRRLDHTSYMIAGSFCLSAGLNYILARLLVVSPVGTTQFNEELGVMTALSLPVIVLPCMVVFLSAIIYLLRGIKAQTGLDYQEIIKSR